MAHVMRGPELTFDPTISLHEYVEGKMLSFGEEIAQVDSATGRTVTYCEVLSRARLVEEVLLQRGVQAEDVVAVCARNCVEYPWVVLGALRAGTACQLLPADCSARELQHHMNVGRPRLTACSVEVACRQLAGGHTVSRVLADCGQDVLVWGGDPGTQLPAGCRSILQLTPGAGASHEAPVRAPGETDFAHQASFVLSSSGTTGLPKGVVLTHTSMVAALTATSSKLVSHKDVALGLMPFCHAYGLCLMLAYLCRGACTVVVDKFTATSLSQAIPRYQVSCLHVVPSLLPTLVSAVDLSSVSLLWTGASQVSEDLQRSVRASLPLHAEMYHSYGMTETTFTVLSGASRPDKPSSPGTLCPGMQCKIVEVGTTRLVGPHELGELCFRGPLIMRGYLRNDEATREAVDADGWLHSGDLGCYDEDEYFYIVDRLKEMIKYQGYQVSPSELESVLIGHPQVKEVAVIGVSHQLYGEVPRALVVVQAGATVSPEELQQYLDSEVSPFKKLRGGVKFVESIPKTELGKIQRPILRKLVDTHDVISDEYH